VGWIRFEAHRTVAKQRGDGLLVRNVSEADHPGSRRRSHSQLRISKNRRVDLFDIRRSLVERTQTAAEIHPRVVLGRSAAVEWSGGGPDVCRGGEQFGGAVVGGKVALASYLMFTFTLFLLFRGLCIRHLLILTLTLFQVVHFSSTLTLFTSPQP
jgi:hypothetical protein